MCRDQKCVFSLVVRNQRHICSHWARNTLGSSSSVQYRYRSGNKLRHIVIADNIDMLILLHYHNIENLCAMERNNMSNKMFSMYNARDIYLTFALCLFGPAKSVATSSLRNCLDTPHGSLWVLEILSFSNYCGQFGENHCHFRIYLLVLYSLP